MMVPLSVFRVIQVNNGLLCLCARPEHTDEKRACMMWKVVCVISIVVVGNCTWDGVTAITACAFERG